MSIESLSRSSFGARRKMPPVRRRHQLLGAWRDREGASRDPRDRRPDKTIASKLDDVIAERDPQIKTWLKDRLAPLVGLATGDRAPPQQDEAVHRLAGVPGGDRRVKGPTVLVIEDLHWADDGFRGVPGTRGQAHGGPAATRGGNGAPRAVRTAAGLRRRPAEHHDDQPRTALGGRDRTPRRRAARDRRDACRAATADPGTCRRATPSTPRSSSACSRTRTC